MTEEMNGMPEAEATPQTMVETTDLPPDGAIQNAYAELCKNNEAAGAASANIVETEIDTDPVTPGTQSRQPVKISCHKCGQKLDLSTLEPFSHVACPACGSDLIVPRWFDNYLLEEIAGVGGMATVYRALDLALDREVAIKVLHPELAVQVDKSELFLHEARTAATINHYAVIPIYTCGIFENQTYIVMQYMGGGSLEMILNQNPEPLPLLHVISWIRDIAMGLENARQHGIVHHDIKPANIMLDMEAKAKIGDFGIAQIVSGNSNAIVEEINQGWLSPHYTSPEKIRTGEEDYRGDIYSLGATFYHLVTGLTPYPNTDLEDLLQKRLSAEPMAPHLQRKDLPEELSCLILAMMAMDPEQRPDYESVVAVLNQYISRPALLTGGDENTGRQAKAAQPKGQRVSVRKRNMNSAFDRLGNTAAPKKRSPGMLAFIIIMHILTIGLIFCGTMFALFKSGLFNGSELLNSYPDFLLETVKLSKTEENRNVVLSNYLHDGRPDLAMTETKAQLQDPNADIRYQAVLQHCFAALLNAERTPADTDAAREYITNMLKSLEANITPYEKIRYEDHLALIRYMGNELKRADLVPGRAVRFAFGNDFKIKLAFVDFLLALHDPELKADELLSYLEDIKADSVVFQAGTKPWVLVAFADRLARWEEVLKDKTGKKSGIEPVFHSFIETEAPWKSEIEIYSSDLLNAVEEEKALERQKEREKEREEKKLAKQREKEEITQKNIQDVMRRHRDVYKARPNLNSRGDNNFLVNKEAQQRYLDQLINSGSLSADDQMSEQWRIQQMQHFNDYLLELGRMKGLTGLYLRGKGGVKADVEFSDMGVDFAVIGGKVNYGEDQGEKEYMAWTDFRQKHIRPLISACIRKQLEDLEAKGEKLTPELRMKLAKQHLILAVIAYWYQSFNDMEYSLKQAMLISENDPEIKQLIIRHFLR